MPETVVVTAIARTIVEPCVGTVGKHLGYIWNYKKNIAKLQTKVEKLDKERADKRQAVAIGVKNVHKIKDRVKGWQNETDKISTDAMQIIKDYEEKGKKRCLMGLCPNLVSRYQFSKRACRKETEIVDAIREASEIREVSNRAIGLGKESALSTEDFFTFDSRKPVLEDIIKTLQDETMNCVGVYGLGGMGKTTLAKQIASQVTKENIFEEVVMASVTKKVDMKEIQGQIASMLDLKLEESSVAEKASRIHERLKGKKVLVILDDLWTKLDLIQVGIPFGVEHIGCKVLLTSRNLSKLYSMGTSKEYVLGDLKEDEAWRLFEKKVIHIVKDPKYLSVGKEVAKRCAGLPVLIVTVAASLAKRPHLDAWNDALTQLREMNDQNMHDIINSPIESISYKYLNEPHKRLFLLCGLLQGQASFQDILKYSLGWDLFGEDAIVTVEGATNRLHRFIIDLKESCLLLDDHATDRIRIHDVVRDVALSIARKDLNAFSAGYNDNDLSRWPKNDVLNKCTAMVFLDCHKLPCFPQRLECPSLELLILSAFPMESKPTIPDTFFERTSKLKVLDMSALCFPTLPSTLCFLKSLQSLHLDYCEELQDISIVGELKKLQVLSLIGSTIQELPSSLVQLSELKLLDLTSCSQLTVVPSGLISGLSQLEVLQMSESFIRWKYGESINSSGRSNVSFVELKCLLNLSCLKVELQDAKLLVQDLNFKNLKRYEIIIGNMWGPSLRRWFRRLKIKTIIALQLGTNNINYMQHVVNTLLKGTECLCLGEIKGINNVIPELNEDGFQELKHLCIIKDSEMRYIVNAEDNQHKASFPALESLHLSGLSKVEKICNAWLMEGSFCNLTIVKVQDCNRLESLFSFFTIIALPCLQEIGVSSCDILEEIVAKKIKEEDDDANHTSGVLTEKIELAQLRKLALHCLPKFMTFLNDGDIPMVKRRQKLLTSVMDSTEIIVEEDESAFSVPLFEEVSFPKLEELELSKISNLTKIWSRQLGGNACCNLTTLTVTNCDNLKYLFTPSIVMELVKVQTLTIQHCSAMKAIIGDERGETAMDRITFPQLIHLSLKDLPILTRFYSTVEEMESTEKLDSDIQSLFTEKIQFPKLEKLNVHGLDSINTIWQKQQLYEVNSFCKLEEITIASCANILKIFPSIKLTSTINLKDESQKSLIFQNLSGVTVNKCESLKYVFPASMARLLNQLKTVRIAICGMEAIIGDDEDEKLEEIREVEDQVTTTFTFPNLVTVALYRLPKAKCVYAREHTINCPTLEELQVVDCGELSVLDFLDFTGKQGNNQMIKAISKMKCLGMRSKELSTLLGLSDLLPSRLSLKELIINESHGESHGELPTFPSKLLNIIHHHLQTFQISNSSFQEIFPYEGDVTAYVNEDILFPQLTKLVLNKLPELEYICKQDQYSSFFSNILDKLKILHVTECPRLINLVPSPVSFKLLEALTLVNCVGVINLLQPSTATRMEQLKRLSISGCEMIEEIIGGEARDDDEKSSSSSPEDGNIFNQLLWLRLHKLPRLTNFCSSRHCTFNFNSLEVVEVIDCPNMKTFCGGITTTPKLRRVYLTDRRPQLKTVYLTDSRSEERWEGELNTTIEKIYEEREAERLSTTFPSILATNPSEGQAQKERVAGTCDKSKGKEVVVSEQGVEHSDKSKTSRYSDPSFSNYTASSSRFSPRISNQPNEFIDLATQVELGNKVFAVCENGTTGPRKETDVDTCDQVSELEVQGFTVTLPSASSSAHFEQEVERQEKSIEKFIGATKEGQISKHVIPKLGTRTSLSTSRSQQNDMKGTFVAKDSISLGEFVHILQTQQVNNVSAEQVGFVEDAIGVFCTYVEKAKECLERKRAISELKLQIQALEDENDLAASSAARFG